MDELRKRVSALEEEVSRYKFRFKVTVSAGAAVFAVLTFFFSDLGPKAKELLSEARRTNNQASALLDSVLQDAEKARIIAESSRTARQTEFENLRSTLSEIISDADLEAEGMKRRIASIPASYVEVQGNKNENQPKGDGNYFLVKGSDLQKALEGDDWTCLLMTTLNSRTGVIGATVFWKGAQAMENGTASDAYGRYHGSLNQQNVDWKPGDQIHLLFRGHDLTGADECKGF